MVGLARSQDFGGAEFATHRLEGLEVRVSGPLPVAVHLVYVEGDARVMP